MWEVSVAPSVQIKHRKIMLMFSLKAMLHPRQHSKLSETPVRKNHSERRRCILTTINLCIILSACSVCASPHHHCSIFRRALIMQIPFTLVYRMPHFCLDGPMSKLKICSTGPASRSQRDKGENPQNLLFR